jgi:hypothetical protein
VAHTSTVREMTGENGSTVVTEKPLKMLAWPYLQKQGNHGGVKLNPSWSGSGGRRIVVPN